MIRVSSFGKVSLAERDALIQKTKRMIPFEWIEIPVKRMPDQRTSILMPEEKAFLESTPNFILLDVTGKSMTSEQLATWLFKSNRHLVVGPAIGFHEDFRKRAEGSISLSALTFTHGLAQTMLAESIYRSACILKNHPFVK